MKEALYYEQAASGSVKCLLCPHECNIRPGKTGVCGVRKNVDGLLYSEIYGEVTGMALDPMEKKPLYHFHPGTKIFSIGTKGCNMKCPYCQNSSISQDANARTEHYSSEDIVQSALKSGSIGIAYTYSEPTIWIEFVLDTASLAREKGLVNVMVTNGYINEKPLVDLLKHTDAMNIDLKTFREDTCKKVQKADLPSVKRTIEMSQKAGLHIELTTLIVTGINDSIEEMSDIIDYIAGIDKNIPWHISRYYPNYRHDEPATDIEFMMKVYDMAVKKLNYVFSGNIPSSYSGSDTVCPSCGSVVISRSGYFIKAVNFSGSGCSRCGFDMKIVS